MSAIANVFRRFFARRHCRKLRQDIESGVLDSLLETLLKLMRIVFWIDPDFRKNIAGFEGRYAFRSKDEKIACSAIFSGGRLEVRRDEIKDTDVTVIFKDGKALTGFLFDKDPDIIAAILENEVTYDGNLNYLAKFAYMAKRLQLMFAF